MALKISQLTPVSTLVGTEPVELGIPGDKSATVAQIAALGGGLSNPMISVGDIIVGGASGVPTRLPVGASGYALTVVSGAPAWAALTGTGTVTSFSVVTANGISGSVATPTTTPAVTLTLGAITPTSVAATGTVTGSNLSGTNTGDQINITGNAGTATKLATARTINGVLFDGSANITIGQIAGINAQTGTTYTLVLSDAGKLVQCNNAAAIALTVPPNSSVAFPINTYLLAQAYGVGAVTVTAGAGVTLRAPNGAATTLQYDTRGLLKIGTDEWLVL